MGSVLHWIRYKIVTHKHVLNALHASVALFLTGKVCNHSVLFFHLQSCRNSCSALHKVLDTQLQSESESGHLMLPLKLELVTRLNREGSCWREEAHYCDRNWAKYF